MKDLAELIMLFCPVHGRQKIWSSSSEEAFELWVFLLLNQKFETAFNHKPWVLNSYWDSA